MGGVAEREAWAWVGAALGGQATLSALTRNQMADCKLGSRVQVTQKQANALRSKPSAQEHTACSVTLISLLCTPNRADAHVTHTGIKHHPSIINQRYHGVCGFSSMT